jgi:hypothetical protein
MNKNLRDLVIALSLSAVTSIGSPVYAREDPTIYDAINTLKVKYNFIEFMPDGYVTTKPLAGIIRANAAGKLDVEKQANQYKVEGEYNIDPKDYESTEAPIIKTMKEIDKDNNKIITRDEVNDYCKRIAK